MKLGLVFLTVAAGAAIGLKEAAVLGALQGMTEFLPVSSSGHIAIGAYLFGMEDAPLTLSIVLHAGTLLATLLMFRKDIASLFQDFFRFFRAPKETYATPGGQTIVEIVVATIPTVVIGLLLRDAVEEYAEVPPVVGACLVATALLVVTTRFSKGAKEEADEFATLGLKAALLVGIAQGLAVLPGISRSGSTIAVAMMLGLNGLAAFRFSFLLSLPAVLGAVLLELLKPGALDSVPTSVWIGGGISFVVGVVSLKLLRGVVNQGRFWAFALYLVPVGIWLIAFAR